MPTKIDYYNLEERDQKAWELICSGRTRGVFQLDSNLGQSWAKKVKPIDITEMSDLTSIIRPGCLNVIEDGKNMAQHYVDRKSGDEIDNPLHPSLHNLLGNTYQILVYQEQAMAIAKELAGFTLEQADSLRKAIGKKSIEGMKNCEVEFLEGCRTTGVVDETTANKIFGWIRESQKYSFNLSHGVAYSQISYWTAYMKANFTATFICASLNHPGGLDATKVVRDLILEAKSYGIPVYPPSVKSQYNRFSLHKGAIYFGLTAVKDVGESNLNKMLGILEQHKKKIDEMRWVEILTVLNTVSIKTMEPLIRVGYFDFTGIPRIRMLEEYKTFNKLTDTGRRLYDTILENDSEIKDLMKVMQKCCQIYEDCKLFKQKAPFSVTVYNNIADYITLLEQSNSLVDSIDWICRSERELLGIELTYSKLDNCLTVATNATCATIRESGGKNLIFAAEICSVREYIIKLGKNAGQVMGFLSFSDATGYIDSVIWANLYTKYRNILYEGNTVVVKGSIGDKGSLIVESLKEI